MSDTDNTLSRRGVLQTAAALGATASLAGCGDDPPEATGPTADFAPLNALLTAEYQAIATYSAAMPTLTTPPAGDPFIRESILLASIAGAWQNHHREHAAALVAAVTATRGTPVVQSSVSFTLPVGFTGTVTNVLRLACNAEKAAAIAYNNAMRSLTTPGLRFLAGTIQGDETQHFAVLYALLRGLAVAGPNFVANISDVVRVSFVSTVLPAPSGSNPSNMMPWTGNGLQSIPDFTYT